MSRTAKALKNHGPCDSCGQDIVPGQEYRRVRGRCLDGEEPMRRKSDGQIWTGGLHFPKKVTVDLPDGGTIATSVEAGCVEIKIHEGCPFPDKRK